jgi:hypothetical protein
MTDHDDLGAWTPPEDLVALHNAPDVTEFQRRLVLYPTALTNESDAFEPWCLFQQFHRNNPVGAATTAILLVTDRRWRKATGRLIRQIEESELVSSDVVDVLAQTFLAAGSQVYWEVPGEWFDGPAINVDFELHAVDDVPDDDDGGAPDTSDGGRVVVAREVRPPVRRWAAGRVLRADPAMWGQLVTRAREIDARGGAAIMRGVLDGVDALTPAARGAVLKLATTWPERGVREAAAELTTHLSAEHASLTTQTPGRDHPLTSAERQTSHRNAVQPSLF